MTTSIADTKTAPSSKDPVAITASPSNEAVNKAQPDASVAVLPNSKLVRLHRSTWFNVIVVGLVSFCYMECTRQYGCWGSAGALRRQRCECSYFWADDIWLLNIRWTCEQAGLKPIFIVGTLGYAPYSAVLYFNRNMGHNGLSSWGAIICGISASALFASEGAIAVGYPLVKERGLATGVWLGLRQFGQLIGAAVQLSINIDNAERGSVGFLSRQCNPDQRNSCLQGYAGEGISRGVQENLDSLEEVADIPRGPGSDDIHLEFHIQSIYLTAYFSVRARTLLSLTSAVGMILGDFFWDRFLDAKLLGTRTTAKLTWIFFSAIMCSLLGWQFANEHFYASADPTPTFDWASPGFGRALTVNLLFAIMNESHYIFVYWLLGHFDKDVETLSLTVGLMRTFESLGATLAFAAGSARTTPVVQLIISFVMFAVAIPSTVMVT